MTEAFAVRELSVRIGAAHILDGVSWAVEHGQTLGLVGESGSGKSMTVLAATGLVPRPPAVVEGQAVLTGKDGHSIDLLTLNRRGLQQALGARIGFVFQDPSTSLNPLMTVGAQLGEGLQHHRGLSGKALRRRCIELLEMVGIPDPEGRLKTYPHEMSGGMRQRVMIAVALSCEPELIIADEPTTALDVTIQAQILDVVRDLQHRLGTSVVWISHDLGVVGGLADRVVVLYGGQVVEQADVETLFRARRHPYTDGLFAARPTLGAEGALATIPGSPPDPRQLPEGCVFYDRCPLRLDPRCATERPPLTLIDPGHEVRSFCATARGGDHDG